MFFDLILNKDTFFFIPGLSAFAYLVIRSDLKYHVIRNFHLLLACCYCVAVYAYLILLKNLQIDLFILFINFIVSFSFAYFLYLKNLWSAGDGKLFIVLLLFIFPFINPAPPLLTCFILFVNIFIIGLLYLLLFDWKSIIDNLTSFTLGELKIRVEKFLYNYLILIGFVWLSKDLLTKIGITGTGYNLVVLYIFLYVIKRFIRSSFIYLPLILLGIILNFFLKGFSDFFPGILTYLMRTLKYAIFFQIIDVVFFSKKTENIQSPIVMKNIAFAPIMFLGALSVLTPFFNYFLNLFSFLK